MIFDQTSAMDQEIHIKSFFLKAPQSSYTTAAQCLHHTSLLKISIFLIQSTADPRLYNKTQHGINVKRKRKLKT